MVLVVAKMQLQLLEQQLIVGPQRSSNITLLQINTAAKMHGEYYSAADLFADNGCNNEFYTIL